MKATNLLINFFLFSGFSFAPLFFGNLFFELFENDNFFFNARYREIRLDRKNISLKRELVEKGYLPFFFQKLLDLSQKIQLIHK